MNKYKKLLTGLGLIAAVGGIIFTGQKVLALTKTDFQNATYTIVSLQTVTMTVNGQTYTFTDRNTGDSVYNWKPDGNALGEPCMANSNNGPGDGIQGTGDLINPPLAQSANVVNVGEVTSIEPRVGAVCGNLVSVGGITLLNPNKIAFGGTQVGAGQDCTSGAGCDTTTGKCTDPAKGCTNNNANAAPAPSCENNNNSGLEWMICPVLKLIDGAVSQFYGMVEDQLCFRAGVSLTKATADTTPCNSAGGTIDYLKGKPKGSPGNLYEAWSNMRILATSLLVIAMLAMVLSQAMGSGVFDAYSVKKMLPKLIAAAILIQISWWLGKLTIDIFNDIGLGIKSLMYEPFGPDIGNIDTALAGIGGSGILALGGIFLGAAALVAFSGLTIFGILLLALPIVLAALVGYLVLLFRVILIMLCMVFMPLAIVCWVLPGTERYWKMWRETFIKLLMMFPLIVALIAAGRIFGTIGSTTGPISGLIMVLVGFFGVLFVLPKTYQWGGSALNTMGGAVINTTKKLRSRPREMALAGAKGSREQNRQDRLERLSYGTSAHPRWDRLLAGGNNLSLNRTARLRKYEEARAKGRRVGEEALVSAVTGSEYENLDHPFKIDTLRTVAQGAHDARTGIDGTNNPAAQRWALDELAKYGDWDIISNLRDNGGVDERTWQAFVAKNISAIHQNIPHLSPQRGDLSTQGYEEIPGYKDFEATELREQAENYEVRNTATGAREQLTDPGERLAHRMRHVTRARAALDDEQVRRRMDAHQIQELETIAALDVDTPTVQVVENTRNPNLAPVVILPNDLSTPQAQESLSTQLAGRQGQHVAHALTTRVASADHNTAQGQADEAAFSGYLTNLQAQGVSSPVAKRVHNTLVTGLSTDLENNIHQSERAAVEAGHIPADIATEVAEATRHRDEKMQRLNLRVELVDPQAKPLTPPDNIGRGLT
jgi:hypothetical protein